MGAIRGDDNPRRHHAALDEGQAHAEPKRNCKEQNSRSMPGPALHAASKMAPSAAIGKVLLFEEASQVEQFRQLAHSLSRQHQ
jgi:hypothetical protein